MTRPLGLRAGEYLAVAFIKLTGVLSIAWMAPACSSLAAAHAKKLRVLCGQVQSVCFGHSPSSGIPIDQLVIG